MARKKKEAAAAPGAPLYMATYGDMVTLLLTFFVFLYSFSSIDVQKFQKMMFSFQSALGVLPGGQTVEEQPGVWRGDFGTDAGEAKKQTQEFKQGLAERLQALAKAEGLDKSVTIRVDQRGVTVSLAEQLLYAPGGADPKPEAKRILYKIGQIFREFSNPVAVEGHTDNTPLDGGIFRDNWGLSAARAALVASYLSSRVGLTPTRLQAVGYGSYRPLVPNDTPSHRAINRRVDLVVLTQNPVR
jgi:chemotaxis protein MotB